MARISNEQIEQLKRNVSVLHVCADHGIELKQHGTHDYAGKCPFHDEDEPSFIVTPSKNLWHCMGCDKGGSVIDLVMELEGIDFRGAVQKLITSSGLVSIGIPCSTTEKDKTAPRHAVASAKADKTPSVSHERAAALLERTLSVYEKNFQTEPAKADPPQEGTVNHGRAYLESRGIIDAALFTKHRIGLSNGKLTDMLPGDGSVRKELNAVGILLPSTGSGQVIPKKERFEGCVVFPVFDEEGQLTTLYGRSIGDGPSRHLYLPNRSTGLWNAQAIKTHVEIILVESVIDALSVMVAGFPNVIAIQGTNGFSADDIETMSRQGVSAIILLLDGDDAGRKASDKLTSRLQSAGLAVTVKTLPDGEDPNSYLVKYGAESFAKFLQGSPGIECTAERAPQSSSRELSPSCPLELEVGRPGGTSTPLSTGLVFTYGLRSYQILGLEKGSRKLRATVRVQHAGKLHVDTVDFYASRSRRILAQDLCRIFDESPETIEADITRLLQACEQQPENPGGGNLQPEVPTISAKDKADAETLGKRSDLIDAILADFETCGLVGEEPNKLLAYLAATSRKTDEPLSVLVLSSSGAGKTALQDTALLFVPPEELVKLTSLSGKALFYKERHALTHKVLSLEEGNGAEEASYAIRNLISAGELVIESTIKDLATGRLTTMENRVEGPTSVFITTTDPEIDPETKSRFFVTSIDEGRDQTRRILVFQRKRQTLDGLVGNIAADVILKVHRNFQRLLKPVAVVNPFADQLAYGDDRLQGRRDQPKYLNLIKAVAFLRQMQKEVHRYPKSAAVPPARRSLGEDGYVLVDVEDVRVANTLAHEILGRSLDELSRPSRSLLLQLDEMVEKQVERLKKESSTGGPGGNPDNAPRQRTSVSFTRREIREFSGWAHTRVHRYLKELIELEYVLIDSGRNGTLCRYRLAYEGQGKNGERFMLGLTDPEQLKEKLS